MKSYSFFLTMCRSIQESVQCNGEMSFDHAHDVIGEVLLSEEVSPLADKLR